MQNSKINKNDLVLDTDGVVLNFIDRFDAISHSLFDLKGREFNLSSFDLKTRLNLTDQEIQKVWDFFIKGGGFESLDPLPGSIEAIKDLEKAGYNIHIVTAIPIECAEARLKNYAAHTIFPSSLHCVGGVLASKQEVLEEIRPLFFVDDRLKHHIEAASVPHRVWIENPVEQHGICPSVANHHVKSLKEWTDNFLANENRFLNALLQEPKQRVYSMRGK